MSASHIAREILEDFWKWHGLSAHWEDDAIYQTATESGLLVWLTVDEEAGLIRFWTVLLPEVPDEKRESVYASLLDANLADRLLSGGGFALNPENGNVTYQHAYDLQQAGPEGFARFFAAFSETASGLRALMETLVAGGEEETVFPGVRI
jgi:hypothetical protein